MDAGGVGGEARTCDEQTNGINFNSIRLSVTIVARRADGQANGMGVHLN